MRVGTTIDVENNTDGLSSVVGNKIGLCAGSCVTGAILCADSCVPGTVKNGVLYATRFVNDFLSDDIVAVAPFVVKLPRCNFSPLGSSIVSISASCF